MLCSKCGAEIATPSQFCPQCGEALGGTQPAASNAAHRAIARNGGATGTDPKAAISMVLGVLSFLLSVFAGIPAVILGHLSRASIRRSDGRLKGEGMAMAGLITGYISLFLLPVLASIVYIAVPNLFRPKIAANETTTVETLKTIQNSAEIYRQQHDAYPASLQELSSEGMAALDSQLVSTGDQSGYRFTYKTTASQKGYAIHADPIFIHTGQRHFYMDAHGKIRFETDRPAGANSQPVNP